MNDHELRRQLNKYNILAGPVISECAVESTGHAVEHRETICLDHTRAIYQRKLLEAITNENSEGTSDLASDGTIRNTVFSRCGRRIGHK